jgi:hypothetical protein
MYVNGKMIPVKTTPGRNSGRGNNGEWWKGEFKYDIFGIR